ncbi:MAG: MaoC family dehydratase [Xanthomonadales bacterium]|nr:MaoC family dehydratase [Xanthomonadales bacterium]
MNAETELAISRDRLEDYLGKPRESSTWLKITQKMIDAFADATFDHQFIHVDPERAKFSPFGSTVAHGFLTLSLIPKLMESVPLIPAGVIMAVNYGLNRVRFPSPVKVGSEIRAVATLLKVSSPASDRVLMTSEVVVQIKGQDKPAVVAESLALLVFA